MSEAIGPQVPIRSYREALGISVNELIRRIRQESADFERLHPDTIRNVELGYKRASVPLMNAWARALGLRPVDTYQPPEPLKSSRERVA